MKKIYVNVKASLGKRRVWLLGIVGALMMILFFSWSISLYAEYRYQYILFQPEVLDAFSKNDEMAMYRVSAQYHLEYQRITDGEVTSQSKKSLPSVTIVIAVARPQKNVLLRDVPNAFKNLRSRILFIERDIFLAFPLFLQEDRENDGYVIYLPLFV